MHRSRHCGLSLPNTALWQLVCVCHNKKDTPPKTSCCRTRKSCSKQRRANISTKKSGAGGTRGRRELIEKLTSPLMHIVWIERKSALTHMHWRVWNLLCTFIHICVESTLQRLLNKQLSTLSHREEKEMENWFQMLDRQFPPFDAWLKRGHGLTFINYFSLCHHESLIGIFYAAIQNWIFSNSILMPYRTADRWRQL